MTVVEIGERHGEGVGIDARQAGAAEHQCDPVMEHVSGDAAPQQLHGRAVARARIDAGASELEDLAGRGDDRGDVVLAGRVEAAVPRRRLAADEAVGSHHRFGAAAARVVADEEVVADAVEAVKIAPLPRHLGAGPRAHLLVEDAIAQRLRGVDVGHALREPHLERAGTHVDDGSPADRPGRLALRPDHGAPRRLAVICAPP